MKMDIDKNSAVLIGLIAFLLVFMCFMPDIVLDKEYNSKYYIGDILETRHNCTGIENYFTNTSFYDDYLIMIKTANYSAPSDPKPPLDMYLGKGVDCDTISPSISCLSKLYDGIECKYYSQFVYDQAEDSPNHLGVKCRYLKIIENETIYLGNWEVYN